MDYLGIAAIIAVVVGAVRFVHVTAFKDGVYVGKSMGRLEVLEEDMIRQAVKDEEIKVEKAIVAQLTEETRTRYDIESN